MKTFVKDRFETIEAAFLTVNYPCTTPTTSVSKSESISIFPNPATGKITLE